jgi:hypothetical protein
VLHCAKDSQITGRGKVLQGEGAKLRINRGRLMDEARFQKDSFSNNNSHNNPHSHMPGESYSFTKGNLGDARRNMRTKLAGDVALAKVLISTWQNINPTQ